MNNGRFSGTACARGILGLVLAIGLFTFLRPCVHDDGAYGTCHWAGQMIAGLGAVLTVQAALALFFRDSKLREGISLSMIPVAALTALTPGLLIPLCGMAAMRCNLIMKPATIVIAVLLAVLSIVDAAFEHNRAKRETQL